MPTLCITKLKIFRILISLLFRFAIHNIELSFLPCNICCCKPTACNCWSKCNEAGDIVSVAVNIGLVCCGGFVNIDGVGGDCVVPIFILAAAKFHKFACICCIFFCSFSFCVSANLTTIGAEQPSIVCDWCKPFNKKKKKQNLWVFIIIMHK